MTSTRTGVGIVVRDPDGLVLVGRRLAEPGRPLAIPGGKLEGEETITPFPTLERIVRPFAARAVRLLESALGGGRSVRSRLDRLGSTSSVEAFRVEQLLWGGLGLLGGVAVSVVLLASGRVHQPVALVVLTLLWGWPGCYCATVVSPPPSCVVRSA